jgi:hypothetical protein
MAYINVQGGDSFTLSVENALTEAAWRFQIQPEAEMWTVANKVRK